MPDSTWKTYRHSATGLVDRYHPRVALADKHLIEVSDDAKPLAYLPIPREAIDALVASKTVEDSEEN